MAIAHLERIYPLIAQSNLSMHYHLPLVYLCRSLPSLPALFLYIHRHCIASCICHHYLFYVSLLSHTTTSSSQQSYIILNQNRELGQARSWIWIRTGNFFFFPSLFTQAFVRAWIYGFECWLSWLYFSTQRGTTQTHCMMLSDLIITIIIIVMLRRFFFLPAFPAAGWPECFYYVSVSCLTPNMRITHHHHSHGSGAR